ncbi:MAG: transcriptional repressor [Muribaculum sp.]|nr:transcriptional repressor [Muribaculaceae bacterium]MCM1080589.1 transcriptional repressor [Muribaculum sp.]
METLVLEQRMQNKGVKPTANRIIVMRALANADKPMSMSELETVIETVDKSSIFRTLTLFLEHHVVHAIEDGSGSLKYELCSGVDSCTPDDLHAHFFCERCHSTYCLENVKIPQVALPDGFRAETINYMIKGLCPKCR